MAKSDERAQSENESDFWALRSFLSGVQLCSAFISFFLVWVGEAKTALFSATTLPRTPAFFSLLGRSLAHVMLHVSPMIHIKVSVGSDLSVVTKIPLSPPALLELDESMPSSVAVSPLCCSLTLSPPLARCRFWSYLHCSRSFFFSFSFSFFQFLSPANPSRPQTLLFYIHWPLPSSRFVTVYLAS